MTLLFAGVWCGESRQMCRNSLILNSYYCDIVRYIQTGPYRVNRCSEPRAWLVPVWVVLGLWAGDPLMVLRIYRFLFQSRCLMEIYHIVRFVHTYVYKRRGSPAWGNRARRCGQNRGLERLPTETISLLSISLERTYLVCVTSTE